MCRTVEDAARVFIVVAGTDHADLLTEHCRGELSPDYTACLGKGLDGVRVGVLQEMISDSDASAGVKLVFETAIQELI